MASVTPETLTYRSDIDGLRAIAVVLVVLYHAGFGMFSGGFVGVDVFFVIFGYLITSIIAQEIARGDFSIRHLYARRARRLFPALFAVLAACCILAPMLLMPWELEYFGQGVVTTAMRKNCPCSGLALLAPIAVTEACYAYVGAIAEVNARPLVYIRSL